MGEMLVDFVPIEEHGLTVGFRMYPGGSPGNVAVGIARLGQPASFVSKLADDFFGHYLRTYLESQQVASDLLRIDPQAPSTLAFVTFEAGEPHYTFYGQDAADTLMTPEEIPTACFEETRIFHFGSISLLRGTTPSAVLFAVEQLRGKALLSFDPNLRPRMVRDEVQYRELIARLVGMSDIVKLSAADLDWLAPQQPREDVAADLLRQGAALVVVTQGGTGVMALRATDDGAGLQQWRLPAFPITLSNTIGAGDAFSAGLLAALAEAGVDTRDALMQLDAAEVERILRFAGAVSAITCTRPGADPPRRTEVQQFLRDFG
jgi:fructokinase